LYKDFYVILLRDLFSNINSTYDGDKGRLGRILAMHPMYVAGLTWRCYIGLHWSRSVFYKPSLGESLSETNCCGFMAVTIVGKGNNTPSGSKET